MNPYFRAVILTATFFEPRRPRGSFFSSVRVTLKTYGFNFWGRTGRGVLHTPLQTFPSRERMQVAGLANNHPKATARALSCPIVGRIQYAPTLTVKKTGLFFEPVCLQSPYFLSEWVGRKSIRPIRRSRQGNERKHPVLPTITQRQPPGPYGARLWGVFNTPLP